MTAEETGKSSILPPRGLLIALAAQLPLMLASFPLQPAVWQLVSGALLLMAGIALNVWADRQFKRAGVGIRPFSPAPVVVESGPYRFTRNPMYLGLIAISLSAALLSGVPLNAWATIAYAAWLHHAFVVPEEAFLLRTLGEPYANYTRRVPRWIIIS